MLMKPDSPEPVTGGSEPGGSESGGSESGKLSNEINASLVEWNR